MRTPRTAGSSWFADSLDRHPNVFISGYEPLEWVNHAAYEGANATSWQAHWLGTVWHHPPVHSGEDNAGWTAWLRKYNENVKLDPLVHPAKLTVHTPTPHEVTEATAVGFKVRPLTLETNKLMPTIKAALSALGGVVIVVNRKDKLRQVRLRHARPRAAVEYCGLRVTVR